MNQAKNRCAAVVAIAASSVLAGPLYAVTPAAAAPKTTTAATIRINAGGKAVTDSAGRRWSADRGAVGGTVHRSHQSKGSKLGVLEQQVRSGMRAYRIAVPAAGTYDVALHLANLVPTARNSRRFFVKAEGRRVVAFRDLPKSDAFPVVHRRVRVTDGVLNLNFSRGASLAGIEVVSTGNAAVRTLAPAGTQSQPVASVLADTTAQTLTRAPTVAVSGTSATITATITPPTTTTYRYLQLGVRDSAGRAMDTAYSGGSTVLGGTTKTLTSTRTYAPGTYSTFLAYSLDGTTWKESTRTSFVSQTMTTVTRAPTVAVSGTSATITATITPPTTTTYRYLQLGVRDSAGRAMDTAYSGGSTVLGGTTKTLTSTRTYAPGTYSTFLAYSLDGTTWKESTRTSFVSQTLTTVSPTPTTTVSPTPTTTVSPTPTTTVSNLSGLAWNSGVYIPGSSKTKAAAFAAWRGRPLDAVVDWSARATWSDIVNPGWLYDAWAGTPYTKVIGVAMVPEQDSTATMAGCAAGSYNDKWRQFGTNIASRGLASTTIIRLGWEFNGNWYKWSAYDPAQFAACWRHIVSSAESTAPALRWDWTVNRGEGQSVSDPTTAYPGDSFVDIVGVDSYDGYPGAVDAASWDRHLNGAYGLQFWANFAAAHAKKMSVPEWGVYPGTAWAGNNGGDNPYYIAKMVGFFKANAATLAYESYFNEPASYFAGSIYGPVQAPKASAQYLALYQP